MPLFLNNDDVDQLLTMKDTMEALEILYREMGDGAAVTAPRSDVHSPTAAAQSAEGPMAHYLKSMSGASPHFGTAALRFSSDIVAWRDSGGGMRREKLPMLPGNRWMGIVMLFSSANGELLAIMNDGVLQRFRVGGANGVATKYLARQNAESVGLIGSGWQAGTQVMAVCEARRIKKIKVFSPTKANREKFAKETSERVGVEIVPVESYQEAVKAVDIIITSTNSRTPFLGKWALAEGIHISAMQRDEFDDEALLTLQAVGAAYPCDGKQCHLVGAGSLRTGRLQVTRSSDRPRHRLEVVADLAGSFGGQSQRTRIRQSDYRLRQQHRHGSAIRRRGQESVRRRQSKGRRSRSAARLVHPGRASVSCLSNRVKVRVSEFKRFVLELDEGICRASIFSHCLSRSQRYHAIAFIMPRVFRATD